jgi:hypothetical protein
MGFRSSRCTRTRSTRIATRLNARWLCRCQRVPCSSARSGSQRCR